MRCSHRDAAPGDPRNRVSRRVASVGVGLLASACVVVAQDSIPPSVPTNLIATAATCGQVNLSWNASVDNTGGSGTKAYIVSRTYGPNTTIGSARTAFSDTNYVPSSTALTYTVAAMDNAGNKSAASNVAHVTTPPCPLNAGETVIDGAYFAPLGKTMATFGSRSALIYIKQNQVNLTWETWLAVSDGSSGQTTRFLLHASPGYYQIETDYVLTSATELWTLSYDSNNSGTLLASQYRLNGSPPTSATLVSTKSLGDTNSFGKSLIRLQSGALMIAWNEESSSFNAAQNLSTGYAYRSPTGTWSVKFPITIPNATGGNSTGTQMILAQHPTDGSIWAFEKRDGFYEIGALHFTELASANDFTIDWINPTFINHSADGNNSPEVEFPFLAATADPTRNAILLAYQSYPYQMVFIDPLYGSYNSMFLKQAPATIAQIAANGSKVFIPSPANLERMSQFGMSVLSDGTIWLAYQPINSQTLTWNQVYATRYQGGSWSTPALSGFNYGNYNVASSGRDPGLLIYRSDQPEVAFMTPDQKVHTLTLSSSAPDTTPPTTSITSPASGVSVSGVVPVTATAWDDIGVNRVTLMVDGAMVQTITAAPYTFSWDAGTVVAGNHTLQTVGYDAAGNSGSSAVVTVTVAAAPLTTSITSPSSGATLTGIVSVAAAASGNAVKMDFLVDGVLQGTKNGAPFSFSWNTSTTTNGSHTLKTVAYDSLGNTAASPTVTDSVLNDSTPPAVSITSPGNGTKVSRNATVTISVAASDNVGVTKVQMYVNGTLMGTDTAAPYAFVWTVPNRKGVSYTLKAVAYDAAGNNASASVTVSSQ
jgi:hypothetical protein